MIGFSKWLEPSPTWKEEGQSSRNISLRPFSTGRWTEHSGLEIVKNCIEAEAPRSQQNPSLSVEHHVKLLIINRLLGRSEGKSIGHPADWKDIVSDKIEQNCKKHLTSRSI